MADQIDADKIAENALAPKKVEGDQGSAEQHSIADQIAADRYKRSTAATGRGKGLGLRFVKLRPPGAD